MAGKDASDGRRLGRPCLVAPGVAYLPRETLLARLGHYLVIGWGGWNHLEQATALVGYYDARKREGWDARRLTPLLAGLDQLLPWIHQWHPEVDPEFGETAGQSFQHMLEADAHELGLTMD